MFCPKCATQNVDGASFCRACGANISLVPQALTGQLPQPSADDYYAGRRRRRRRGEPTVDEAIRHLLMAVGFVVFSLAIARFAPGGRLWWFWLFIPAFIFLARGIADFIRLREIRSVPVTNQSQIAAVDFEALPPRRTGELRPPVASVTEGTTRHLNAEPPTRHFESGENRKP